MDLYCKLDFKAFNNNDPKFPFYTISNYPNTETHCKKKQNGNMASEILSSKVSS